MTPSIILFPAGAGRKRLILNQYLDNGRKTASIGCQEMIKGKLVNRWSVALVPKSLPQPESGTLARYLGGLGYFPSERLGKAAQSTFRAIKGYATYQLFEFDSKLTYGFVLENGQVLEGNSMDVSHVDLKLFPNLNILYPATKQERNYLLRS